MVDLPPDPVTGKRWQKRVSAPTKKACESEVLKVLAEAEQGAGIDAGKLTVRDFLDRWLAAATPSLKPATARRYRDLVARHVVPLLGGIKLAKLSPADVQRLHADRLAAGLSPTTVVHLHYLLHRALEQALRWGLVARNVSELVDPPRRAEPPAATWDASQVAAFLAASEEFDRAALWRLALLTGMRRGEVLGLTWSAINLERGVLAVRRTLSRGQGGWRLGSGGLGPPATGVGRQPDGGAWRAAPARVSTRRGPETTHYPRTVHPKLV